MSGSGWSERQCARGREGEWELVERETMCDRESGWEWVERETVREREGEWERETMRKREGDWEWSGRQCASGRVIGSGAGDNVRVGG